jgi:hypothetical protein
MYAQDSIELLKQSGIDFAQNETRGIDVRQFGELLTVSGVVLNEDVSWLLLLFCCCSYCRRCCQFHSVAAAMWRPPDVALCEGVLCKHIFPLSAARDCDALAWSPLLVAGRRCGGLPSIAATTLDTCSSC